MGDLIRMQDPAGHGAVTLECPMDANLAAALMTLLGAAGWEFDTEAMRAAGTPMPTTEREDS